MISRFSTILLSMVLLLTVSLGAEQHRIRLACSNQPSCWSLEDIVRDLTAGLDNDRDKALALHEFGMAHQIHYIGPYENGDYVVDALKIIGVYGYNLCGNNSATMCALYELAGLQARRRGLVGHVVPEVWFDNKWNYIDTDMFGYVFLDDREQIASVDELIADPDLWTRPGARRPEPFFPWDPAESMKRAFINPDGWQDRHPYSLAHVMDLGLRTGESVTFYYRPQGTSFYYLDPEGFPESLSTEYRDYWIQGPVRGPSLAWTDTPPASYGNGCLEYTPDLRSEAFHAENRSLVNISRQNGNNLPPLISQSRGQVSSLTIEVKSPWVITGRQNDLINFRDNTGGALVHGWFWRAGTEDENRILVSTNHGVSWKTIWENDRRGAVPFAVDFTPEVDGGYGYLVKFEWLDRSGSGKTGLEGLRVETWTQLSPMGLPRLVSGLNTFTLSTGSHSAVLLDREVSRQGALPDEKLVNFAPNKESKVLWPVNPSQPGNIEFGLGTGGIVDTVRLALQVIRPDRGVNPEVVLSLSENGGVSWQELKRFAPHPEHGLGGMWFNHILKGRSLDGSRARLKVEVTGGGLARIVANSLVRENPGLPVELRVSHVYREGSTTQTVSWNFPPGDQNTTYEIEAPEGVRNVSFRIEALPPVQ